MAEISGVPTKKQQKFILTELIPAILREQGSHFSMEYWHEAAKCFREDLKNGDEIYIDGLLRFSTEEECNSVSCIGGTADALLFGKRLGRRTNESRDAAIAKKLGLTYMEAYALFYRWNDYNLYRDDLCWPENSMKDFVNANTPLEKAQVVAALLVRIATEGGKCLHRQ